MRFVLFTQSLISCWNHGNAHFLRGVLRELLAQGHAVRSFEPEDGWSRTNLVSAQGAAAASGFATRFPELVPHVRFMQPDIDAMLQGADVVLVHEWTDPALVAAIGRKRAQGGEFTLLFHDTHHRAVSDPDAIFHLDLSGYDAVLAFGNALAEVYRKAGWGDRVFTWHEAADTRLFCPPAEETQRDGMVFIGNWGDDERGEELRSFLLHPAAELKLPLDIYGVRYPDSALVELAVGGAHHRGWIANACVPSVFARHAMTVHVPRRVLRDAPAWHPHHSGIRSARLRHSADLRPLARQRGTVPSRSGLPGGEFADGDAGPHARPGGGRRIAPCAGGAWAGDHPLAPHLRASRRGADGHSEPAARHGAEGSGVMRIAFYGSSLLSSYWNGAATYYRGLLAALARRGWQVTFYEPDAFDRQSHRDIDPPNWAAVRVYPATPDAAESVLSEAAQADVAIKASGVGVFDDELLQGMLRHAAPHAVRVFWDVDAPATLAEIRPNPLHPIRRALRELDAVLTYGGGSPVVNAYGALGAALCRPIYNALDPSTHFPVPPDPAFATDLCFLANRMPDREARAEEFFFRAATLCPQRRFLLGGNGWDGKPMAPNVRWIGHVGTQQHNAFNASALAVLNVARESMASMGFCPATRVFEAAGAGACLITDAWEGVEQFLAPDEEVLVARDGAEVADRLRALQPEQARAIGDRARRRVLAQHTYEQRADEVDALFRALLARKRQMAA